MYTLYSLTSGLHSETVAEPADERFIQDIEKALGEAFEFGRTDFSEYFRTRSNIIYVRTGGTEGIFKSIFCKEGSLNIPDGMPVRLLTSGKSNSLAASMEILSFLNRAGWPGEIIHGSAEEIALRLRGGFTKGGKNHVKEYDMGRILEGYKVGVIGKPSDWLISSDVDYAVAKERLGVEIVDIDINELVGLAEEPDRKWLEGLKLNPPNKPKFGKSISGKDFSGSMDIYCAMKTLVERYGLAGVSLRCFDLLTALGNTGCMALAILNSQGVVGHVRGRHTHAPVNVHRPTEIRNLRLPGEPFTHRRRQDAVRPLYRSTEHGGGIFLRHPLRVRNRCGGPRSAARRSRKDIQTLSGLLGNVP